MKTFLLLTALSVIILSGCSTSKSTTDYDDVYSTTKKKTEASGSKIDQTQVTSPDYYQEGNETVSGFNPEDYETGEDVAYGDEPYLTSSETVTTPEGTNYITNNYYEGYGGSDYYDYSYAERIDRFYGPNMGYNYYSPCYTGYYYDPWYWDSYWYMPSFYFGFSWGWGSMYWGYPYYSYYYPYNSYWYGYNDGYYNGYWDGYYGYDYYYYGDQYYGHRSNRSGSGNTGSNNTRDNSSANLMASKSKIFDRTNPQLSDNFKPGRNTDNSNGIGARSTENSNVNQNLLIANPQNNNSNPGRTSEISNNESQPGRNSSDINGGSGVNPVEKINSQPITQDKSRESNTSTRYTYKKPVENSNAAKEGYKPGQTIKSNENARPTQKYSKPADQSSSGSKIGSGQQGTNSSNQNTQTYSRPQSNNNNSYSKPSGYNSNSQGSNQPSRSSNNSYSQPSRSSSNSQPSGNSSKSYSSPSRSSNSGSYSSPSRSSSSGSYSSPSRSSSGSSGSSSSRSSSSGSSSGGGSRGGRK